MTQCILKDTHFPMQTTKRPHDTVLLHATRNAAPWGPAPPPRLGCSPTKFCMQGLRRWPCTVDFTCAGSILSVFPCHCNAHPMEHTNHTLPNSVWRLYDFWHSPLPHRYSIQAKHASEIEPGRIFSFRRTYT